ncbi:MAG: outer membrane beta-barrel domain-containing protein [Pseudomonadota bacterium]
MESRIRRIFLNPARQGACLAPALLLVAAGIVHAEDAPAPDAPSDAGVAADVAADVAAEDAAVDMSVGGSPADEDFVDPLDPASEAPLIDPDVARREVRDVKIDSENLEIGVGAGFLSIEDFGSSELLTGMVAWHFTEDLFLQANVYMSEAGQSSYEVLSGNAQLLDDRDYLAYDLSVGYNLFPGEAFVGRKRAYNTAFYLLAGIGSTDFGGEDRLTLNLGVGYRLLMTDWLAWHVGFRDHMFASDITGQDKNTHNMELTTGVSTFF